MMKSVRIGGCACVALAALLTRGVFAGENPPATVSIDLTADKPGAGGAKYVSILEEISTNVPLSKRARETYSILGDSKASYDMLQTELSPATKDMGRMKQTAENLSKNLGDLATMWKDQEVFRGNISLARRSALLLGDELDNVPKNWTRIHWVLDEMGGDLKNVRLAAKVLADAEPKPVPYKGKDGEILYREPDADVDPHDAKKAKVKKDLDTAKKYAKEKDERNKGESVPVDLDGNTTKGRGR